MNSLKGLRFALFLTVWASTSPSPAGAQTAPALIVMVVYLDEAFERYVREGRIHTPRTWTRRWSKAPPLAFGR